LGLGPLISSRSRITLQRWMFFTASFSSLVFSAWYFASNSSHSEVTRPPTIGFSSAARTRQGSTRNRTHKPEAQASGIHSGSRRRVMAISPRRWRNERQRENTCRPGGVQERGNPVNDDTRAVPPTQPCPGARLLAKRAHPPGTAFAVNSRRFTARGGSVV